MVQKHIPRHGKLNTAELQGDSSVYNMEEKEERDAETSQESMITVVKPEQCRAIITIQNPQSFQRENLCGTIYENLNEFDLRTWRCVTQQKDYIVLVKCDDISTSFYIKSFDRFVVCNYQGLSSSTANEPGATALACDCFNNFSTVRNILNSTSNNQWACFWKCHEKTYFSNTDETTSIPIEDFSQLDRLVGELTNMDINNVLDNRVPLGETENAELSVITSHLTSQEDFFKEINELVFQKRKTLKAFNTLVIKYCGNIGSSPSVEPAAQSRPRDDEIRSLASGSLIPLPTLLQCIVVRLTPSNWEELRRYVGRDIPTRVLRNVPNNIEFFQELENRDMIHVGNTDYVRSGLYEIERVDLVHLLDCIQDGDYSLLTADIPRKRRNRNLDRDASSSGSQAPERQMRHLATGGKQIVNTADQVDSSSRTEANTQAPVSEGIARSSDVAGNEGTTETRERPLQRRYRNVPQGTAPSTPYPVQEDIREEGAEGTATSSAADSTNARDQNSANESNESDTSSTDSNVDGAPAGSANPEGLTPQGTNPQGVANSEGAVSQGSSAEGTQVTNVGHAVSQGSNAEDAQAWLASNEFSCEHYNRYCLVQFECCPDKFWPCHRCHNSRSECGQRKLRSRDVKKLKCRRCNTVQDFPKETGRCVKCDLKFAEYFCPICQHLTGVQNHPFHCEKCGICRVHGDRSFHCDVCGVCLDKNLYGNHTCRAGSAHDVCVICSQDAFTGCQLLPCSHKVHKDCASQMLRNGTMRCPVCKTTFNEKKIKK